MKKRVEAELISIAHRILKLKNKSEIDQLYKETQKLYETLTVLKFYQDNFETVKAEVSQEVLEEKLANPVEMEATSEIAASAKEEIISEPVAVEEVAEIPSVEDESFEDNDVAEEEDKEDHEADDVQEEAPAFTPIFELGHEEEEVSETEAPKELSFDTLLGENYADPVFVKPNEVSLFSSIEEEKKDYLNDSNSKSIDFGLNDRIGFVQHLFDGSNEDFNRVLSQLITFDSYEEAKNFIEDMVKPDYDNWKGVEDYEERFMEAVEKKFQ